MTTLILKKKFQSGYCVSLQRSGFPNAKWQNPDAEVARIAKENNIPVIAITGTIGKGANVNYDAGIDAYNSIIQKPSYL